MDPAMAVIDDEPQRQWTSIETELVIEREDWGALCDAPDRIKGAATFEVCQRLERALTRMWTLGAMGENGRTATGLLSPFLYLDDEELGRRRRSA
jgi:hypothetical protein